MKPAKYLPAMEWLRVYDRETLSSDLLAGVIVTIMLIPQSLAYAMLAGLPPHIGLYASILPLIGYAMFGSSRTIAVGPVAVVSLMTAAAIGGLAEQGSDGYLAAAIALAVLSGLFLTVLGLARLGFLANLLSHPVISGFISASAVLIAASQLGHLLGIPARGHSLYDTLERLAISVSGTHVPTLVIGVLSVVFLFWTRNHLRIRLTAFGVKHRLAGHIAKAGPVAAVVVSTAAVAWLGLANGGVAVVGSIPGGLPDLSLPAFDADLWAELVPAAMLISIVGFVESVSVAQTLAAKRRERIDPNRELIALGVANLASGASGAYPVTGGFARSVVNFDAGARTPMAGIFTALGIALTALFLTPLFEHLPKAVLAATIVVAVLSLIDLKAMARTWRYSKSDFAAMAATIAVVLAVGIEAGIVAGVTLSIALFLWRTSRPHMAIVGQVPATEHFRNIERHEVIQSDMVLSVRVDESLYFANARQLEERIYGLAVARPAVEHVVLMCPAVNLIDASALESLEALADRLRAAGVTLHLSEVKGPVMDRLERSDFFEHFDGEVFLSQYAAMLALDSGTTARADAGPARVLEAV